MLETDLVPVIKPQYVDSIPKKIKQGKDISITVG